MKQNMSSRAEQADFFHLRGEWRPAQSTIWEFAAQPLFAATIRLFLGASAFLASCSFRPADILASTHVTIVDMTGAPPRADQTIIIKQERIAAIGALNTVAIPRGAQIFDARGKFLIPGLVDMHVH